MIRVNTKTKGIFQSDILIRTAIIEGLRDLRQNPWLLDYAFAWLPSDALTASEYGYKELEDAKNWFLENEIVVTMAYHTDRPQLPAITVELLDSMEINATLGDTHYEPSENITTSEIVISPSFALGPFTPKTYDSVTGVVTFPDGLTTAAVFVGMILYDATASNKGFVIEDVINESSFKIPADTKVNFTKAYVASRENFLVVPIKSLLFRENYRLTCFVQSNMSRLLFLHTILMFILLRNKEDLFEARGFENSTISSGSIVDGTDQSGTELIFKRDTTITGQVRHYWPGKPTKKLDGFLVESLKISGGGKSPAGISSQVSQQGWEMEEDSFAALRR